VGLKALDIKQVLLQDNLHINHDRSIEMVLGQEEVSQPDAVVSVDCND